MVDTEKKLLRSTKMQKQFETTKQIRGMTLGAIKDLNDEQLLKVPEGFNNNILWNLGHMVISQQYFIYHTSGLDMLVPHTMGANFGRGTSPANWESTPDIAEIKTLAMSTMEQWEADIKADKFQNYEGMNVGTQLETADDAAIFNCYHEGEHFGTIKSILRLV